MRITYDVVCAGAGEEVGNQSSGLGDPLLVPRLSLKGGNVRGVLKVVSGVCSRQVRDGTRVTPVDAHSVDTIDTVGAPLTG